MELSREKALASYQVQNEKKIVAAFQNIDPSGFFHITAVSLVAITFNNQKLKEADVPKTWRELLDPKWSNKIALGDPNFSGMVGAWTVTLQKMYGWDYFSGLAADKPLLTRSIDDTVTILNSGERVIAAGDPASTLRSAAKGNPLSVFYPNDGAIAVVDPRPSWRVPSIRMQAGYSWNSCSVRNVRRSKRTSSSNLSPRSDGVRIEITEPNQGQPSCRRRYREPPDGCARQVARYVRGLVGGA